jgi:predicted nuclease of predicted toxin-antitoxin system
MKLLLDMNLSPDWVSRLAISGIEAVHWSTIGAVNAKDSEIMAYAERFGYIVLTHDLDFSAILAATRENRPSVVQLRADDLNFDEIGAPVVAALLQMRTELEAGALLTIDRQRRIRVRLLSFSSEP